MDNNNSYVIGFHTTKCTGCQACVMACSYHTSKHFSSTSGGCIEVFKHNDTGNISIVYDEQCCDMCSEEQVPLCMQYCSSGAVIYTRKKIKHVQQ